MAFFAGWPNLPWPARQHQQRHRHDQIPKNEERALWTRRHFEFHQKERRQRGRTAISQWIRQGNVHFPRWSPSTSSSFDFCLLPRGISLLFGGESPHSQWELKETGTKEALLEPNEPRRSRGVSWVVLEPKLHERERNGHEHGLKWPRNGERREVQGSDSGENPRKVEFSFSSDSRRAESHRVLENSSLAISELQHLHSDSEIQGQILHHKILLFQTSLINKRERLWTAARLPFKETDEQSWMEEEEKSELISFPLLDLLNWVLCSLFSSQDDENVD